ncbi:MAG: arsenite efflux transporter metallochaperone ArsD [Gracilimonas sp.]
MSIKTATKTVEVYDPAMCCSTGVCGPDVDDALVDFANDVKWLKTQGVEVNRFNLGQEPEAFKMSVPVVTRLQKAGTECLPIILVNGEVVAEGGYPDRQQLLNLLSLQSKGNDTEPVKTENLFTNMERAVTEGDETKMRTLFTQGEEQGIGKQELVQAIQNGINVRQQTTQTLVNTANELLGVQSSGCGCGSGSGCC